MSYGATPDVETGAAGGGGGAGGSTTRESMAAEATRLLSRGLESVGLKAAAPPPPPTALEACAAKWCPELSWSLRLQIFAVLLVCAAVMFLLAYFIGLPLLLLRPDKFAFAFTSGSVCLMLGVALLDGPVHHAQSICSSTRWPITCFYYVTLAATVAATLKRQYIFVIAASCSQLVALVIYCCAFIPGGLAGLKVLWTLASSGMLGGGQ
jgi:hypothetical protein